MISTERLQRTFLSLLLVPTLSSFVLRPAWGADVSSAPSTNLAAPALDDDAGADSASVATVTIHTQKNQLRALQSTGSVETISPDDIKTSGANNLVEAIQHLEPSADIDLGADNTFASSRVAKSASLHGLGPDETLILVDGERQALSALPNTAVGYGRGAVAVDLDSIPLSAIDHIEILKDGAAAQYGSDAIGGVINIVLKKDSHGGDLSATEGEYTAFDKPRGPPKPTNVDQGTIATSFLGDGYIDFSADLDNLYHPRDGYDDNRQYYFAGDPRNLTVNRGKWCTCNFPADENSYKGILDLGKPLTDEWQFYSNVGYAHSLKVGLGFATLPSSNSNVRALTPDGYQADSDSIVDDYTGAVGVKYTSKALGTFDLSSNFGYYRQLIWSSNDENAALGLATPRGLTLGTYLNQEINENLTWSKPLDIGFLAQPLNLSAGLSNRAERYAQTPGEWASYATGGRILDGPSAGVLAPSAGGLTPQDAVAATRDVHGGWVNAEYNPTQAWLVGAAGRLEDYSDFNTIHTEKAWSRYTFAPNFSVNASIDDGFRAPALAQSSYATTSYSAINGVLEQSRTLPVDNPIARALGAEPLRPEKALDYDIGTTWEPTDQLSFIVDAYKTYIDNRITITDPLTGTYVTNVLKQAGYPQVYSASFFVNGPNTATQGLDVTGKYKLDLAAYGKLEWSLSVSALDSSITRTYADPPQVAASGLVLIDRRILNLYTGAVPHTKSIFETKYDFGSWETIFTEKRYGTYRDLDPTPSLSQYDQTYPVQWISNMSIEYKDLSGLYVIGGINNIFDSHPGLVNTALSVTGIGLSRYNNLAPEGSDGTYYYATIGYKF